jgi:hypothetical protein
MSTQLLHNQCIHFEINLKQYTVQYKKSIHKKRKKNTFM